MAGKASVATIPARIEGMPTRIRVISWTALGSMLVLIGDVEDFDAATVPDSEEAICSQTERDDDDDSALSLDEVEAERSAEGACAGAPVRVRRMSLGPAEGYLVGRTSADADDAAATIVSRRIDSRVVSVDRDRSMTIISTRNQYYRYQAWLIADHGQDAF